MNTASVAQIESAREFVINRLDQGDNEDQVWINGLIDDVQARDDAIRAADSKVQKLKDEIVDAAIDWWLPDAMMTVEASEEYLRQAVINYLDETQPDGAYGRGSEIPVLVPQEQKSS